jgi:hypothetical protein
MKLRRTSAVLLLLTLVSGAVALRAQSTANLQMLIADQYSLYRITADRSDLVIAARQGSPRSSTLEIEFDHREGNKRSINPPS